MVVNVCACKRVYHAYLCVSCIFVCVYTYFLVHVNIRAEPITSLSLTQRQLFGDLRIPPLVRLVSTKTQNVNRGCRLSHPSLNQGFHDVVCGFGQT